MPDGTDILPQPVPSYHQFDENTFRLNFSKIFDIFNKKMHFDGIVQNCSNSIANALEILQSCTKPLIRRCDENVSHFIQTSMCWLLSCASFAPPHHHVVQLVGNRNFRADSRLAPSQWETSLQSNAVSHWLGANLESTLNLGIYPTY